MERLARAVDAAVAKSALARLSPDSLRRLLEMGHSIDLPPGGHMLDEDSPFRVGLLVTGVLRLYRILPDGRQLTVMYDHSGDLPGLILVFAKKAKGTIEAVTPSTILLFPPAVLRTLIRTDGQAALVIAEEFALRAAKTLDELTGHVLGSLRERVGHHLLAAVASSPRPKLVAELTHEAIADATGAARESVTRTLRDLEREGVIKIRPRRIEVLNADALCPSPVSHPLAMIS